jgi:hypothetical protein
MTKTWRYGLIALPLDVARVGLTLVGAGRAGARVHLPAARLLGVEDRVRGWRVLANLPVDVVAFIITAVPLMLFVGRGLLYPVWYGGPEHRLDWGGPTLVGRWAAHAGVGVLTILACLAVVVPIGRLAARVLGGRRGAAGSQR